MSSIHSEWSSLGHVCPKPSYKWAQRAGVNSFRPVIWPHHKGSLGWPRASWGPQKMAIRTSPKRPSRTGSTGPPGQVRGDFPRRPCPCALTRFGTRSLSLLVQPCTFHLPAVPWISPSHFFHSHHNPSTAPHLPSNPSRPSSLISKQLLLTLPGCSLQASDFIGALKRHHSPRVAGQKASDGTGRSQSLVMSSEVLDHVSHLLCLSFLLCEMRIWMGTKYVSLSMQQTPRSSCLNASWMEKQRFLLQNCIFRWDYSEPARLAGKILQFSQIPLHS